ncbi:hypothetical protein GCM10010174_21890 [Kutzneria viridogrisea]
MLSVTAFGSMAATRSIGTKIRRRVTISTTTPSTLGGCLPIRNPATRSLTLPIGSPSGPNTGKPASCAAKTLLVAATVQG